MLGPVFRTHDPDEDRLVAVKAFTLDVTPEQAVALASELDRLTGLDFDVPSVTAPVAAGVEDFVPFVAAPYVSGESLDAAIRQYGPAPAGDAIRLIGHVAEALDAAAHLGVFHGSMHPRDILVTPGETHVTGFGVAQALERVGLHGPVRRPYVAPEREGGDAWGAAADIYSLAVIAYEVLTGRRALPGTEQPLPALNDIRVHDPVALREAIEAALDPDPRRRPAQARDFAAGFAAALSEAADPGGARDRSADRRPRKPRARPPKLPGLDEPLQAPDSEARVRPRTAAPAVPVAAVPVVPDAPLPAAEGAVEGPGVEAPAGLPAATGDIRYVPVSDPADDGERPQNDGRLAEAPGVLAEPAPDVRQADDVLPRGDAAGETVDAELAAALDRLATDSGDASAPTPLIIDNFGPAPAALAASEAVMGTDARTDPAADTALTPRVEVDGDPPAAILDSAVKRAKLAGRGLTPLDFTDFDAPRLTPELGADSSLGLDLFEASPAPAIPGSTPPGRPSEASAEAADAEPARAFVRGRSAERRRTPSRYGRAGVTPGSADRYSEADGAVPRAFEPERPTPPAMPGPDFDMLTRQADSRPPIVPAMLGVVAGLILGLAAGYWLGTRNVPQAAAPPTAIVASDRPAPAPPVPIEAAPPAVSTAPADASPAPIAPERAAAPVPEAPAGSARGAIQVTSSQQANVYVDGERRGMTPRNLQDVPLGSHTIRVTRPGYAPQEQTVVLTPEEPSARLAFTLRWGSAPAAASGAPSAAPDAAPGPAARPAPAPRSVLTVLIASTPSGARIRIDGRDLGPTPLTVRQLRPGTHTLELRLPGYRLWSQRLTVAVGDRRQIAATLERDSSR